MGVAYVIKMNLRKILNEDMKLIQLRGTSNSLLWARNEPPGFKHGRVYDWLRFCLLPHYPWYSFGGLAPIFPRLQQYVDVSGQTLV
jgi:hypothetical protein